MTTIRTLNVNPADAASITNAGKASGDTKLNSEAQTVQNDFDRLQQAPAGQKTLAAAQYAQDLHALAKDEGISSTKDVNAAVSAALQGAGANEADLQLAQGLGDNDPDAAAKLGGLEQLAAFQLQQFKQSEGV